MHNKLKIIHNNLSIKLEKLTKAQDRITELCKQEKILISKNIECDNNVYDIILTFDKDDRIESIVNQIMLEAGCSPCASGSFEQRKSKMIFTLYL